MGTVVEVLEEKYFLVEIRYNNDLYFARTRENISNIIEKYPIGHKIYVYFDESNPIMCSSDVDDQNILLKIGIFTFALIVVICLFLIFKHL